MAAMLGVPGDEVGKTDDESRTADDQPSEQMADSSVPSSTVSEQLLRFTPRDTDEMTVWELSACVDGELREQSAGKVEPPTDEEFEQMLENYDHLIATPQ